MEFKGTKGEWEINPRAKFNVRCNNFTIANCSSGQDGERELEEMSNAKLIAAAPELLEALQHALRLANLLPNKESIAVKAFVINAEKAINKALWI